MTLSWLPSSSTTIRGSTAPSGDALRRAKLDRPIARRAREGQVTPPPEWMTRGTGG